MRKRFFLFFIFVFIALSFYAQDGASNRIIFEDSSYIVLPDRVSYVNENFAYYFIDSESGSCKIYNSESSDLDVYNSSLSFFSSNCRVFKKNSFSINGFVVSSRTYSYKDYFNGANIFFTIGSLSFKDKFFIFVLDYKVDNLFFFNDELISIIEDFEVVFGEASDLDTKFFKKKLPKNMSFVSDDSLNGKLNILSRIVSLKSNHFMELPYFISSCSKVVRYKNEYFNVFCFEFSDLSKDVNVKRVQDFFTFIENRNIKNSNWENGSVKSEKFNYFYKVKDNCFIFVEYDKSNKNIKRVKKIF